jgi:hypothetical protein
MGLGDSAIAKDLFSDLNDEFNNKNYVSIII